MAGRDVRFTLDGLGPWQEVRIEFVDPRGESAEWITDEEQHFKKRAGVPVTSRTLFGDESGMVHWVRVGTLDSEGVWSVRITVDGRTSTATYPVSELQLPVQKLETLGVELLKYRGLASDTYFSALVPASLALDLQAHLSRVIGSLRERLGIQSGHIPDIYLLGSRGLFEEVSGAIGEEVGFEAGYYQQGGPRPGIYMRADFLRTAVQRTLTHEYMHLVLGEISERGLPAWLNEGLARYWEYEMGLEGERSNATRLSLFVSADQVKAAAKSGTLLPLPSLESREVWNSQVDETRIDLQYAEAYMAVRFLIETHGSDKPVGMVKAIGRASTLAATFPALLGITYEEFQRDFNVWLMDWEYPTRSEVRDYIRILNKVLDESEAIRDRRRAAIKTNSSLSQEVPIWTSFVSDARALFERLQAQDPPLPLESLHEQASNYLSSLVDWFGLGLDYRRTRLDPKRVQGNNMISEIHGRGIAVSRGVSDVEFVYNLLEE